jgi:acetate kinase
MSGAIAVLNSGSSSIKFSLYEAASLQVRVRGQLEAIYSAPKFVARDAVGNPLEEFAWPVGAPLGHDGALDHIVSFMRNALGNTPLMAVGHRVVHGGVAHDGPVRMDAKLLAELQTLVPLAPLHQPHNLAPIRRLLDRAPNVPQVACFDTAFHRTQSEVAQAFALPRAIRDRGVRRFGFHGLSYEYIASQLPAIDPAAASGRTIVLHLGNGASICALQGGKSVATTMGFTAVDGLVMGTRCGSLDPGVVLYMLQSCDMDIRGVEKTIYQESGLLGLSGISGDMRTLLASEDPRAKLAVDVYLYRIRRELGGLAAVLGGVDALVFTAGIGENSAEIRSRICRDAAWLGVQVDEAANVARARLLSASESRVKCWRIPTDEEGVIARHTRRLAQGASLAAGVNA